MHFLEDSCKCCYISSSSSCLGLMAEGLLYILKDVLTIQPAAYILGLMAEGLLYILKDVPDNPASSIYPASE